MLEVTCTNPTARAMVVTLAGPDGAESTDGLTILPATTGLKATKCWTGRVTVTEVNSTAVPVVGFCHTDAKTAAAARLKVPAGGTASTVLLSARYTTVDTDGPGGTAGVDPVASAEIELAGPYLETTVIQLSPFF